MFEGMLIFQLAGALILLLNSINGSNEVVIKNCFSGSNMVERDDNDICTIPKEKLRNSAHKIYLNIVAFLDLVIGYGIAAFSPSPTTSTLCTFAIVLAGSFTLMVMEYFLSKWGAWAKYPVDELVPYSKLKKHGVDTNITGKELDEMLSDIFRD